MSSPPHILVPAAGASTRLGQPKQLATIRGQPALQIVLAAAQAITSNVTVVLGAQAADITRLLQHSSATVLINRQWREGLASSIRQGVASLSPGCEAVLILLGDQVGVTVNDLKNLVSAWREREGYIAAGVYRDRPGVPAIFPQWCFSELLQLRGDVGAKWLLQRHAHRLVRVAMPHAEVDLDTPQDLEALNAVPKEPP